MQAVALKRVNIKSVYGCFKSRGKAKSRSKSDQMYLFKKLIDKKNKIIRNVKSQQALASFPLNLLSQVCFGPARL